MKWRKCLTNRMEYAKLKEWYNSVVGPPAGDEQIAWDGPTTAVDATASTFFILIPPQSINLFMLPYLLMRFGFDLANAFASDAEDTTDFFKCVSIAIKQTVAHLQNLPLFGRQVI